MKIEAKTIDEFFAAAGEREPQLRALDQLIQTTLPGIDRRLFESGMFTGVAYGMYYYTNKSGVEMDWPVITMAPQKNYISLYIMAVRNGKYITELYGNKLGKVSIGKSCIRFKKIDDLNATEIKNVLRDAAEWYKEQTKSVS
jgi:hypothetical protein